MHPISIGGRWRPASDVGRFTAFNPQTSEPLADEYPVSDWSDCEEALNAAASAAEQLELVPAEQIARFLEGYADRLHQHASQICEQAELETALPVSPRLLDVEMPRTINQLRLAADAVRTESWRNPVSDSNAGIYSCYGPIGPTLVFGPNNFPFAFNAVSGGDFAAAIAAGNPVIAKAHSAHPSTSRLLAEQALAAVEESELPPATVQLLYGLKRESGLRLVADSRMGAAAFTGSRAGGLALKSAADAAGVPIYLEMSSVNPVFFLPGAVAERGDELASELAGSCLLGVGQFCTCPNLSVLIEGETTSRFLDAVKSLFNERPVGALLSQSGLQTISSSIDTLRTAGAELLAGGAAPESAGYRFENTLLSVTGKQFLANPGALQTEAFGPSTLVVVARDEQEVVQIAAQIEGSLTASVYSSKDSADDELAKKLMQVLRRRAGRLLNDKMPTGVAVSPAMNHGGPFPATGHPGFTAVGLPASIRRFSKLDCYDNVRPHRLPDCLRKLAAD